MDIPWDDVRVFLAVAESGSLSAAAKRLRTAQPTVSRRLAALEAHLGDALFDRSVSGATLTSFGERLLEPARKMAQWSAELDRAAERRQVAPRGVVRVTAPPGVAWDLLAPFAAQLAQHLPDVQLEVSSSTRYLDIGRREADLALRFAGPASREVVALETVSHGVGVFAAPRYIATLKKGYGLADVRWIGWAPPFETLPPNGELAKRIPGFRPAFAADDFLVQLRAAEEGAGAIVLARMRLRTGRDMGLRELALDLGPLRASLELVASRSALEIPRVRAVADLLAAELRASVPPKARAKVAPAALSAPTAGALAPTVGAS